MTIATAKHTYCILKHYHPSIMEANYCLWMFAKLKAGDFYSYRLYKSFQVSKTKAWKPDFIAYDKTGKILEVHECKGMSRSDDNFRFKLALFFEKYPALPVFVNKRRVFPSASGRRILNLPRKRKRT